MLKHTQLSRNKEIAIVATVVAIDVIVSAILNLSGAAKQTTVAFAVGLGIGAVVVYVITTNKEVSNKTKK